MVLKNNILGYRRDDIKKLSCAEERFKANESVNWKKILKEYLPVVYWQICGLLEHSVSSEQNHRGFNELSIEEQINQIKDYLKKMQDYIAFQFENLIPYKEVNMRFEISELSGSGQQLDRANQEEGISKSYYVKCKILVSIIIDIHIKAIIDPNYENRPESEKLKNKFQLNLQRVLELESFLGWH